MRIPISKLKAILLYFVENTNPRFLGKTKLMKLFYFLDFMHIKKFGAPVTYDSYYNLEHGPIPTVIKNLVDEVYCDIDSSVLSDTIEIKNENGEKIHRVRKVRDMTISEQKLFSENELETLVKVCKRFKDVNTKQIEDISHKEAPWKETSLGDFIPYTLAAEDNDCEVSKEEIELMMSIF